MRREKRRLTVYANGRMTDKQQREISKLGYRLSVDLGYRLDGIQYLLTRAHVELLATQEESDYVAAELRKLGLRVKETRRK